MSWEHKGIVEMREEFIFKLKNSLKSISQLCRDYKITRRTAYKWIKRFSEEGITGLYDRSKKPARMPTKTNGDILALILAYRDENPEWGAKKLRQVLGNAGYKDLPSISTFNRILHRENKISEEAAQKRQHFIRFERENPNELWQMDFKGHFNLAEGKCHPLTMLDDCSRFSLCLKACSQKTRYLFVKHWKRFFINMAYQLQ